MTDGYLTITARLVICVALISYNGAIFMLMVFPTERIYFLDYAIATYSVFAAMGLIAHTIDRIQAPGEKYVYLFTALNGLVTLLVFDWTADTEPYEKIRVSLFLLTGAIGALAAHAVQEDRDAPAA